MKVGRSRVAFRERNQVGESRNFKNKNWWKWHVPNSERKILRLKKDYYIWELKSHCRPPRVVSETMCFQIPSGRLKPWTVLNPPHSHSNVMSVNLIREMATCDQRAGGIYSMCTVDGGIRHNSVVLENSRFHHTTVNAT